MNETIGMWVRMSAAIALCIFLARPAPGNGGPFVVKYPDGDPAAKGVLARLDPTLKPARETRLRVVKEDLKIAFTNERFRSRPAPTGEVKNLTPPLAEVTAAYTIENPTDEKIEVDFGFPILRGIYIQPLSMMPSPDVQVKLGNDHIRPDVISNSAIYGLIRQRSREVIEKAITDDEALAAKVARVRTVSFVREHAQKAIQTAIGKDAALRQAAAEDALMQALVAAQSDIIDTARDKAREALRSHLTEKMQWNARDAALLVEFATLDFGVRKHSPRYSSFGHYWGRSVGQELIQANIGALSAIGEQKATQLFAYLASRFDPTAGQTYEDIFKAWGGDVRERSVDIATGKVRPREIAVGPPPDDTNGFQPWRPTDPTIYARVDYFDDKARILEWEKRACKAVLKSLPVVFTFAPMNLIHYKATFAAKKTVTLTVTYKQFAFKDTADPATYQLAYVVHPASLWDDFGPIDLEVAVPDGVGFRASINFDRGRTEEREIHDPMNQPKGRKIPYALHYAQLASKKGELLFAVNGGEWDRAIGDLSNPVATTAQSAQ